MREISVGDEYMVTSYVYKIIKVSGESVIVDIYDAYGKIINTSFTARARHVKNWVYIGRAKPKLTLITTLIKGD